MKNQIVLLGLLALCTHSQMSAASPQKSIYHKGWIDFNKNGVMDIYEDPKAPLEDRVQDLLSQMTLDEKTCQMATLYGSGRILKDALPQENWKTEIWKDGIGNIDEEHNGLGKFRSEYAFPYTRHVDTKHAIQRWFIEETRLGIPVDFTNEGIRGLCHDRATYENGVLNFPTRIANCFFSCTSNHACCNSAPPLAAALMDRLKATFPKALPVKPSTA